MVEHAVFYFFYFFNVIQFFCSVLYMVVKMLCQSQCLENLEKCDASFVFRQMFVTMTQIQKFFLRFISYLLDILGFVLLILQPMCYMERKRLVAFIKRWNQVKNCDFRPIWEGLWPCILVEENMLGFWPYSMTC